MSGLGAWRLTKRGPATASLQAGRWRFILRERLKLKPAQHAAREAITVAMNASAPTIGAGVIDAARKRYLTLRNGKADELGIQQLTRRIGVPNAELHAVSGLRTFEPSRS
jgi:hypothetical protein